MKKKQLKPLSHTYMYLPLGDSGGKDFFTNPERYFPADESGARHTFDGTAAEAAISGALTRGGGLPSRDKLRQALEEISVSCARYTTAVRAKKRKWRPLQHASHPEQVATTKAIRDAAMGALEEIDLVDRTSMNRLCLILGGAAGKSHAGRSKLTTAQHTRRMDLGLARLNRLRELLFYLQHAADEALQVIPTKEGRPPEKTPLLERSLVHELVDIWCRFHDKPYEAPSKDIFSDKQDRPTPRQAGAAFVKTVIEKVGFDFAGVDQLELSKVVRREREREWKDKHSIKGRAPEAALRRELDEAMRAYVSPRG